MQHRKSSEQPEQAPDDVASRVRTVAVDFDGVIADYDGWAEGQLGAPRSDTLKALQQLRSEGWKIVVHSCRSKDSVIPYLEKHNVPYDDVNPGSKYDGDRGKPIATVYWDDRALRYSGDALKDLEAIRNFRTWNGRR
jgi:adenylylsulfate kinase